jgi:hypothetical protein
VDFCVTKDIPQNFAAEKSCCDLSSNNFPVVITLTSHALNQEKQPSLSNRHTNWDDFRHIINQRLTLNVSLQTEEDIEAAVTFFNDTNNGQVGTQRENIQIHSRHRLHYIN